MRSVHLPSLAMMRPDKQTRSAEATTCTFTHKYPQQHKSQYLVCSSSQPSLIDLAPGSITMSPIDFSTDAELLFVLLIVAGIVTLQVLVIISFLCYRNYKGKARWRRLRERGIILLEGPAMYWTDDLPVPIIPIQADALWLGQTVRVSSRTFVPEP